MQRAYGRAEDIELGVADCYICFLEKEVETWGCEGGGKHPICKECKAEWSRLKRTCPVCSGEPKPNGIVPNPVSCNRAWYCCLYRGSLFPYLPGGHGPVNNTKDNQIRHLVPITCTQAD